MKKIKKKELQNIVCQAFLVLLAVGVRGSWWLPGGGFAGALLQGSFRVV